MDLLIINELRMRFMGRPPLTKKSSRIAPLNLIEMNSSVFGRSVAALPFGASYSLGLPAGEIGSGRRHAYCLVTLRE